MLGRRNVCASRSQTFASEGGLWNFLLVGPEHFFCVARGKRALFISIRHHSGVLLLPRLHEHVLVVVVAHRLSISIIEVEVVMRCEVVNLLFLGFLAQNHYEVLLAQIILVKLN